MAVHVTTHLSSTKIMPQSLLYLSGFLNTGNCIQEVTINFSFQLQTSQVFKKELPILVLKHIAQQYFKP